jgi:hypothetical protein
VELENPADAGAHQRVVVGQHHSDGVGRRGGPSECASIRSRLRPPPVERAADGRDALAHAEQAGAVGGRNLGPATACRAVFHDQPRALVVERQRREVQ